MWRLIQLFLNWISFILSCQICRKKSEILNKTKPTQNYDNCDNTDDYHRLSIKSPTEETPLLSKNSKVIPSNIYNTLNNMPNFDKKHSKNIAITSALKDRLHCNSSPHPNQDTTHQKQSNNDLDINQTIIPSGMYDASSYKSIISSSKSSNDIDTNHNENHDLHISVSENQCSDTPTHTNSKDTSNVNKLEQLSKSLPLALVDEEHSPELHLESESESEAEPNLLFTDTLSLSGLDGDVNLCDVSPDQETPSESLNDTESDGDISLQSGLFTGDLVDNQVSEKYSRQLQLLNRSLVYDDDSLSAIISESEAQYNATKTLTPSIRGDYDPLEFELHLNSLTLSHNDSDIDYTQDDDINRLLSHIVHDEDELDDEFDDKLDDMNPDGFNRKFPKSTSAGFRSRSKETLSEKAESICSDKNTDLPINSIFLNNQNSSPSSPVLKHSPKHRTPHSRHSLDAVRHSYDQASMSNTYPHTLSLNEAHRSSLDPLDSTETHMLPHKKRDRLSIDLTVSHSNLDNYLEDSLEDRETEDSVTRCFRQSVPASLTRVSSLGVDLEDNAPTIFQNETEHKTDTNVNTRISLDSVDSGDINVFRNNHNLRQPASQVPNTIGKPVFTSHTPSSRVPPSSSHLSDHLTLQSEGLPVDLSGDIKPDSNFLTEHSSVIDELKMGQVLTLDAEPLNNSEMSIINVDTSNYSEKDSTTSETPNIKLHTLSEALSMSVNQQVIITDVDILDVLSDSDEYNSLQLEKNVGDLVLSKDMSLQISKNTQISETAAFKPEINRLNSEHSFTINEEDNES